MIFLLFRTYTGSLVVAWTRLCRWGRRKRKRNSWIGWIRPEIQKERLLEMIYKGLTDWTNLLGVYPSATRALGLLQGTASKRLVKPHWKKCLFEKGMESFYHQVVVQFLLLTSASTTCQSNVLAGSQVTSFFLKWVPVPSFMRATTNSRRKVGMERPLTAFRFFVERVYALHISPSSLGIQATGKKANLHMLAATQRNGKKR
jgi:hypothetical protein